MRYAAAIKALKLTLVVGLALTAYAVTASSTIDFRPYINEGRVIPGWVRFSWFFSRLWFMGGWLVISGPVFLFATLWINERMRQKEKKAKEEVRSPSAAR